MLRDMRGNNILGMLGIYAAAFSQLNDDFEPEKPVRRQSLEERRERIDRKIKINKAKLMKSKGLTQYFYNDGKNSLWALNDKSADKKATKKGWI